jgi:transposase
MMRFYTQQHRFYCGVDLHARTLSLCILDPAGQIVVEATIAANPAAFLKAIAPFRDGLVVGCECLFAWYWLADLCATEQIAFVLGHALYLKAIHGGKAKTDRIDAAKLARVLRGGTFPLAYVYPRGMRETRDLLRRRTFLVRRRAELLTHLQILNSQYNLPPLTKKLSYAANREELDLPARFADPSARQNVVTDLTLIDHYDARLAEPERFLVRTAKVEDVQTYHRLQTVPGIGKVLALVLLYEIHDIRRFPEVGHFLSYARLVRCAHESAGKKQGSGGHKIGNAHLKWAFAEAACLLLRSCPEVRRWKERRERKYGAKRALAALAARLGRAVYHLWRKGEAFDLTRFLAS